MNLLVFLSLSVFVSSVSLSAAYLQTTRSRRPDLSDPSDLGKPISCKALWFLALLIPPFTFFTVWSLISVNIPFQDDIDAILESTTTIAGGQWSLKEFWSALFRQDDERRIVVVRLVACMVYWLTSQVDFRLISLAGICSYLIFLSLVRAWFRSDRDISPALFLPVPYVLFSNFNYAALYQAMVPLQHIGVYVLAFASIWLVSRDTRAGFVFGAVAGMLSVFSDITGIFIGPVVALMLLFRRRWQQAIIWIFLFGILTAYYLKGLTMPDFRPSSSENLASWPSMLIMAIAMPGMVADVFLAETETSRLVCAGMAGLVSLSLVAGGALLFGKKLFEDHKSLTPGQWWLAGCILFLLITFFSFAFGRAAYGAPSILLSRYKHMFTFWGILNYLLFIQIPGFRRWAGRHLFLLQTGALIYFGGSYFQTWGDMLYLRKTIQVDAYGWTKNREFPSAPIYLSVKQEVDSIFTNALNARIYQFPDFPFERLLRADVRGSSEVFLRQTDFVVVGAQIQELRHFPDDGMYLLIHSANEMHVVPMRMFRNPFLTFLRTGHYYQGYCESMGMLGKYLDKKKYRLTIGVISGANQYLLTTGKEVMIE